MTRSPVPSAGPECHRHEAPVWYLLLGLTLAFLGFFLPFSSAGVAIAEFFLLLLLLARPGVLRRLAPWREPVMAAGLLLLGYMVLHTLAIGAEGLHAVNRYQELLAAPLLMALLHDARHRVVFIRAVMVGALVLALTYWAALLEPRLYTVLGNRRISAGFALAICAFVMLLRARGEPRAWSMRALAAFMALTVLFAIDGRTGHVVLLALASCAAWLHSPRRWRWPAALAIPIVVVTVALGSDAVNSRLKETLAGMQPGGKGPEVSNSTGIRIELLRLAGDLVIRHGLTGAGYDNYSEVHEQAARARYREGGPNGNHLANGWVRASNPHNEYLMQLIGGGIPALALFLAWLGLTWRHAARTSQPVGGMLAGITLAFAIGALFNSLLMDFVEGHLYVTLLAWLMAESRYALPQRREFGRILVVATRQIGDVLLTTPLIHSARRRWPKARIDVLAFEGTAGMLRGHPDVHELIESPAQPGRRGWSSLLRRLGRRYDLALVTDPGDRGHLIGFIASPLRCGIVAPQERNTWLKKSLLHHAVISAGDLGSVHAAVEKERLLAPWPDTGEAAVQVGVPPAEALPPQVRQALQPRAVVVHAPSMWPYKQWPVAHFRSLVGELLAQGHQVILTGSGSERDQACIAPLRKLAPPPRLLDLSGQLNFNQLVTVLRGAALYIGPDTSVSHLAAATGVPVIAIFGPTNALRWAPWPARAGAQTAFQRCAQVQQVGNVTIVQGLQSCVPCGRAGCENHRGSRSDCLESITPEQVLALASQVLGRVEEPVT